MIVFHFGHLLILDFQVSSLIYICEREVLSETLDYGDFLFWHDYAEVAATVIENNFFSK